MIEIKNATKTFGTHIVFENINLTIQKRSITGIVGYNGSGKTILFKSICGLIALDTGTITVRQEVVGKDVDFPRNMGVIIETPGFLPYLNGFKNLKQLASISNKIDDKRIAEVLTLVGLDATNKSKVATYSLGMKQRLGIAQAIMEEPDILILDEPFNGLDENGVEAMRQLIQTLNKQGVTILLASHQRQDIDLLCTEVYRFQQQQLIRVR